MSFSLLLLLVQTGLVYGSNYGYVEWSENDKDPEIRADIPTIISTQNQPVKEPHHYPTYHPGSATELEEELPRVVTSFLHTGDSSALRRVNCTRRYELRSLRGSTRVASHSSLHTVLDTVAHATNFLSMILQTNRSREHSLRRDIHWYHALVRSILEGDPRIHRAVVTFHADAPTSGPHIFLQATRKDEQVILQDLSGSAHLHLRTRTPDSEWFHEFRDRKPPQRTREGYLLDKSQIRWSAPFLECERGSFVPHWLLTVSAAFYGLRRDSEPEFRGVVRVDVNLQDVDINQCSSTGWFSGTHRCNLTSMECTPLGGHGFVLDQYTCQCRRGFYPPSRAALTSPAPPGEEGSSRCLPCREGCPVCRDDSPCLAPPHGGLRLTLASLQGVCMLLNLLAMLGVYHHRRNKRIRASGLILLETILVGALLLYFPVMVLYFQPSVFRCVLLRWVRLLGFSTTYGTVLLKLYRVLRVFLSRTAQRTPFMTGWRVLRLLGLVLLVVLWFLVGWTAAVFQHQDPGRALLDVGLTRQGQQFSLCLLDRWDYMMAVAEFLFLLWGVYLCYAVRSVLAAFHEPRYLAAALHNELLLSALFHCIRFYLAPSLHPDWMLMLFFIHTHLTVTVTLGLLLVPKFLLSGRPVREDTVTETYDEELDLGQSGSCLNNSITSAWSEHSLDPEEIREELRRVYSQLEVYKHKKMLSNNPHLQKKRSSKRGLGRSLMRRITELPDSVHMYRQTSREGREGREGREDSEGDHGSNRSTLRRNPFDGAGRCGRSHQRDDSLKSKVLDLTRSLSYDHICAQEEGPGEQGEGPQEQGEEPREGAETGDKTSAVGGNKTVAASDGSLLGSLIGRRQHTRKSPETPPRAEQAGSAESVPLVCSGKSVSAHNLTADKKPALLRTSIMQKSLSAIASAKERMPGLANRTAGRDGGGALSEVDETPECYPSKMIISQSVECSKTAGKMGIMRAAVSGSQPSILYDLEEVCPWDDTPAPADGRAQKHVSIALGETTTAHRRGSGCSRTQVKQRAAGQSPSNRRRSKDKGGEREEGREGREGRKPRSPLPLKPEVCPWDFEEKMGDSSSLSPDRIRRKKSVTPTDGKPKALHSDHSKSTGSLLQPPSLMVDICPWDEEPPSPSPSPSSPTPHSRRKRKGSCSSKDRGEKGEKGGRDREEEKSTSKSKERRSSGSCKPSERRRISQSSEGGPIAMTTSGRRRSSTRDPEGGGGGESRRAEVCPWESQPPPSPNDTSFTPHTLPATHTATKTQLETHTLPVTHPPTPSPEKRRDPPTLNSTRGSVVSTAKMADVCPWDYDDTDTGKKA